MRSELALVTAVDETLPADGAILVKRHEVPARDGRAFDSDEHWRLTDGKGHEIAFTVEDLGSSVERWVPNSAADRDLLIIDEAGKRIAKLHQTKASSGGFAAPKAVSLTSTASLADMRPDLMGVPGGTTAIELSADPPPDVRYLAVSVTGSGARVQAAIAPTANQREFISTSYAHKSCARGGPGPIFVGERVALTWIDGRGRRSSAATLTATKQR